ncbi:hypothetical protein AB0L42_36620 [Streptomyces sp. NPDC052287]|uniref:hypothetical protein n=1 Tax=Streptomyces sp. NPDC052287 TaxID=3154950 RepID=UPI0034276BF8
MAQQTRIARARRWWRSTPRLIQRFSIILLVIGAALASTGVWLDHTNWWEGHNFLINLVSSFTSLCFGVPTALLVLSHLGNAQADARQQQRAENQARSEIHEFQVALTRIFNAASTAELATKARSLQTALHPLRTLIDADGAVTTSFFTLFNDVLQLEPGPSQTYREPASFAALSRDRWQWRRIETWHVRVETQWRVLSDEVRPRMLECHLPWIERSPANMAELAVRRLLDEDRRNPWRLREGFTDSDAVEAMGHFLGDLLVLCRTAETLSSR